MLDRLPNAMFVVNPNIADSWSMRPYIHKYKWNLAKAEIRNERVFHAERQDSDPVDSALQHPPLRQPLSRNAA